ncbi:hypothetical protein [Bradyrhizobium sp. BR 1432]|uniref:hypothetical protein n=1 Tax=Bradyrhizobium sp. BR 1432 TaxID=3447966 RepID=UPI003EE48989
MFIKVLGCAIGNYENLAGGLLAADAAIFAGWLAWSAVQMQITADERRASADRVEVEGLLQTEMIEIAEVLAALWRLLEVAHEKIGAADPQHGLPDLKAEEQAVRYGIEQISRATDIETKYGMASILNWSRRALYQRVFAGLAKLRVRLDDPDFEPWDTLVDVKNISVHVRTVRPETEESFEGFFERAGKAWSLGEAILYQAGMEPGEGGRASGWKVSKTARL